MRFQGPISRLADLVAATGYACAVSPLIVAELRLMLGLPGLRTPCPFAGVGSRDTAEYRRDAPTDQGAGAGIACNGATDSSQARSGGCVADDVSSATDNIPISANTEKAPRRAIASGTIGMLLRRCPRCWQGRRPAQQAEMSRHSILRLCSLFAPESKLNFPRPPSAPWHGTPGMHPVFPIGFVLSHRRFRSSSTLYL